MTLLTLPALYAAMCLAVWAEPRMWSRLQTGATSRATQRAAKARALDYLARDLLMPPSHPDGDPDGRVTFVVTPDALGLLIRAPCGLISGVALGPAEARSIGRVLIAQADALYQRLASATLADVIERAGGAP